mgnify:CR=1 FL=1
MSKLFATTLFIVFSLTAVFSQGVYNPKEMNNGAKGVLFNKEFAAELQLNTNGNSLGVNLGKLRTYYKTTFYHISIGELKHSKEYKNREDIRTSNFQENSRSYVFGKQNNLYALRVGMGVKKYLSEKARRKGVAIGYSYEFGPTLGLLKPYYLELRRSEVNNIVLPTLVSEKFSAENAEVFLDPDRIFGASSFVKGLSEVKPRPGIHLKGGIHFDWGAFDEFVKAIEIGVMADVFFGEIDIMVDDIDLPTTRVGTILPENVKNQPFFINLYLSIQLGKRR